MIKLICDKKIEKYKHHLKNEFWTLTEVYSLFIGITEFIAFGFVHPTIQLAFGREKFGLFGEFSELYEQD